MKIDGFLWLPLVFLSLFGTFQRSPKKIRNFSFLHTAYLRFPFPLFFCPYWYALLSDRSIKSLHIQIIGQRRTNGLVKNAPKLARLRAPGSFRHSTSKRGKVSYAPREVRAFTVAMLGKAPRRIDPTRAC